MIGSAGKKCLRTSSAEINSTLPTLSSRSRTAEDQHAKRRPSVGAVQHQAVEVLEDRRIGPEPLRALNAMPCPASVVSTLILQRARHGVQHRQLELATTPSGQSRVADLDVMPVGAVVDPPVLTGRPLEQGKLRSAHGC